MSGLANTIVATGQPAQDGKTVPTVAAARVPIGIWAQWPPGGRWANEGMVRLLGFLIEGIAQHGGYVFHIVLPDEMRDPAEADLGTLAAVGGRDYVLHSPRDYGEVVPFDKALANFANRHVPVVAWLSLFPHFALAAHLEAPLTVIFPDAIPSIFPSFGAVFWAQDGAHNISRGIVETVLLVARRVVTFSRHVARDHLQRLFGFPADRISVVPHAAPDLAALLPFMLDRRPTPHSRLTSGEMLRLHAGERGWRYLSQFPFEDVPYIAVSTADRVTKNLRLVIDATKRMVRDQRISIKVLMTSHIHVGERWTPVPDLIASGQLQFDIISVPDLPRAEHAAFYHCAAVTIHPSIFEGGHAPFPFYESVSVGTPSLMAVGPHIAELIEDEPDLAAFCFDPFDVPALQAKISWVLEDRAAVLERQLEIYARLSRTTWADVAHGYAEAALQGAVSAQ